MPAPDRPHPPQRRHVFAALLSCALVILVAACHRGPPPPPANVTPDGAVFASLDLTRQGDFDGLMQSLLPPADYRVWRSEWETARTQAPAATPAQRRQFEQAMQMLTQPGAEGKLYRLLEPELATLRKQRGQQLPILTGILQAAGQQVIAGSDEFGAGQKQMATQALNALIAWLQSADLGDDAKARQAIGMVCTTARKLNVQTLEQWRALDYAQAMQRYGIAWKGLLSLLKLYGLDLDASLGAARVETLSDDGSHALVQVTLTLAGRPVTGQWHMLKVGNAWYDAERLAAWRKRHPAPPASSSPAQPASAASGAQPPAGTTAAVPARTPAAPAPASSAPANPPASPSAAASSGTPR